MPAPSPERHGCWAAPENADGEVPAEPCAELIKREAQGPFQERFLKKVITVRRRLNRSAGRVVTGFQSLPLKVILGNGQGNKNLSD